MMTRRSRTIGAAAVGVFLAATTACKLYSIEHAVPKDEPPPGIPFLPIEVVRTSTAVYVESFTELTLTLERVDPPPAAAPPQVSAPKVVAPKKPAAPKPNAATPAPAVAANLAKPHKVTTVRYFPDAECAAQIVARFASTVTAQEGLSKVEDVMLALSPKLEECKVLLALPRPRNPAEVKNSSLRLAGVQHAEKQVPSADPLYINVKRPAAGTASANITLAANGTLTSAEAEVESGTLEAILGALPIADAVKMALGMDDATQEALVKPGRKESVLVQATLISREVQRQYIVSVETPLTDHRQGIEASAAFSTPDGTTSGASITIKEVKSGDLGEKTDDKAIQFSGSVKLPEAKPKEEK